MRRWSTYLQKRPTHLQKSHTYLRFLKEPHISVGALCISADMRRRWSHKRSTYISSSTLHIQNAVMVYISTKEADISTKEPYISTFFKRAAYISSSTLHPRMEEIRLKIFGSPDLPDFRVDLLSDGDSVSSREISYEILGTPVKTCLMCTGIPVTTCWSFGQS